MTDAFCFMLGLVCGVVMMAAYHRHLRRRAESRLYEWAMDAGERR